MTTCLFIEWKEDYTITPFYTIFQRKRDFNQSWSPMVLMNDEQRYDQELSFRSSGRQGYTLVLAQHFLTTI